MTGPTPTLLRARHPDRAGCWVGPTGQLVRMVQRAGRTLDYHLYLARREAPCT